MEQFSQNLWSDPAGRTDVKKPGAIQLIDQLKATDAPPPGEPMKARLTQAFRGGHPDAHNRLLQTLRDWERIARKNRT